MYEHKQQQHWNNHHPHHHYHQPQQPPKPLDIGKFTLALTSGSNSEFDAIKVASPPQRLWSPPKIESPSLACQEDPSPPISTTTTTTTTTPKSKRKSQSPIIRARRPFGVFFVTISLVLTLTLSVLYWNYYETQVSKQIKCKFSFKVIE